MIETRIYLVNLDEDEDITQDTPIEEFIEVAEKQGTVYSVAGFIQALNDEEINISNSFVRAVVMDTVLGLAREVYYNDILNPITIIMDDVIQYIMGMVDEKEMQQMYPCLQSRARLTNLNNIKRAYSNTESKEV